MDIMDMETKRNPIFDFHSHILPGMDDGAADVETACRMLECLTDAGVGGIALTPHYNMKRETPEQFLMRRAEAEERLARALGARPHPRLVAGAEIAYCRGMYYLEDIELLHIGQSEYMLPELPKEERITEEILEDIELFQKRIGCSALLAHIERYLPKMTGKARRKLWRMEVTCQINGESAAVCGKSVIRKMRKKSMRWVLGSDCHNLTDRSPELLLAGADAVRNHMAKEEQEKFWKYSEELFDWMSGS